MAYMLDLKTNLLLCERRRKANNIRHSFLQTYVASYLSFLLSTTHFKSWNDKTIDDDQW